MPKPQPLPSCCREHIQGYINIDPTEYPRAGAALCCAGCKARLTYTGGTWHREGNEAPKEKGGLLDVADH